MCLTCFLLVNTAADLTTNITEPIRKSSLGNSIASDVITYLLKCGANINAVDNYNQTPLNYAAVKGNIEAMAILLKWPGIDVEVLVFLFRRFLIEIETSVDVRHF